MRSAFLLAAALLTAGAAPAQDPLYRVGLGFGVGFGSIAGASVEAEWHRAAVIAGVGAWRARPTYEAGVRYYFRNPGLRLRPHATVNYAATHSLEYSVGSEAYTGLFYGLNFLGGFDHDFGRPGGFMMTYGLGLALPLLLTSEDADRFEALGEEVPEADPAPTLGIGMKYQF